jgi:hypothetical protein
LVTYTGRNVTSVSLLSGVPLSLVSNVAPVA